MDPSTRNVLIALVAAALVLAIGVSQFASDQPDGLEYVAQREGFADSADEHALEDAPLAGYGENLTGTDALDTAVAGLVGVAATMALGYGVFWLVRRRGSSASDIAKPQ